MEGLVNFTTAIADGISVIAAGILLFHGVVVLHVLRLDLVHLVPAAPASPPALAQAVDPGCLDRHVRRVCDVPELSDHGERQHGHELGRVHHAIYACDAAKRGQHSRQRAAAERAECCAAVSVFLRGLRVQALCVFWALISLARYQLMAMSRDRRPPAESNSCLGYAASTSLQSPTASSACSRPAGEAGRPGESRL